MQYFDFLEISIPLLHFLPALFLSFMFLSELRRIENGYRRTEILGFVAFTFLVLLFVYWTLTLALDFYMIDVPFFTTAFQSLMYVSLLGVGLVFLVLWTLGLSRPQWIREHQIIISILSILVWGVYIGSVIVSILMLNPITGLLIQTLFFLLIFGSSLFFVLLLVKSDKKGLLLFFGILFFYFSLQFNGFFVINLIRVPHITMVGLWLIVLWKVIERNSQLLQ